MSKSLDEKHGKLILISIVAAICFNFPILHMLGGRQLIAGIPQFYFLLFVIWLGIILLSYLVLANNKEINNDQHTEVD